MTFDCLIRWPCPMTNATHSHTRSPWLLIGRKTFQNGRKSSFVLCVCVCVRSETQMLLITWREERWEKEKRWKPGRRKKERKKKTPILIEIKFLRGNIYMYTREGAGLPFYQGVVAIFIHVRPCFDFPMKTYGRRKDRKRGYDLPPPTP